jgi:hypothetical protein
MLRAYTDNTEYANRTSENNISSPLLLNGEDGQRPNWESSLGHNAGVGFRYITWSTGSTTFMSDYWDIASDDFSANLVPIVPSVTFDGANSSVMINLDADSNNPPADSRWIDKITIESAATTPSTWNSDIG